MLLEVVPNKSQKLRYKWLDLGISHIISHSFKFIFNTATTQDLEINHLVREFTELSSMKQTDRHIKVGKGISI